MFRQLCAILAMAAPLIGQTSIHGTITGYVTDPSGAAVAGAVVHLESTAGALSFSDKTGVNGFYQFPRVAPGQYSLTVEHPQFARSVLNDIAVSVNEQAVVNASLRVGPVTETVTVNATPEVVQSSSSSVSLLVDETRVRDLPLNSKNFQRLVYLAPGVAGGFAANPSASGSRGSGNNWAIDGLGANEEREAGIGLAPAGNPPAVPIPNVLSTEAIQEFRVISSNADATFGRGSGAQINVITKSGTNELHGSLYEYLRNDKTDARDFFNRGPFFDSKGSAQPPPFRQNLFGGSIGGPIVKNRHFFFGNYEGFLQRLGQTAAPTLPNADLLRLVPGDLGRFMRAFFIDSGTVPASGNPAGDFRALSAAERTAAIGAGFPTALFDGSAGNGEAGVVVASRSSTADYDVHSGLIRSDHRLTDRLSLSMRYSRYRAESQTAVNGLPGTVFAQPRKVDAGVAQLVYAASPNQVFELRGGFQQSRWSTEPRVGDAIQALAPQYGMTIQINGMTPFVGSFAFAQTGTFRDRQNTPQAAGLHTWTHGALTLRSGFDIRHLSVEFANNGLLDSTYRFNGLVGRNGLLGASPQQTDSIAESASTTIFGANGGPPTPLRDYRSLQQEYFTQADWRVAPGFTLNLGLRYSIFGVYKFQNASNLYAVDGSGRVVPGVSPFEFGRTANRVEEAAGHGLYRRDLNNFQPRVGFAWDIGRKGATIVRAAYGIYHDRIFQFGFGNVVTNPPLAVSGTALDVPLRIGTPIPVNPNTPNVFGIDPSMQSPSVAHFNVAVERRLDRATSVTASYVGSRSRKLARVIDVNMGAAFPQAQRPDPRYVQERLLSNVSGSDYDSFQVFANRRLARGFTFNAAYTYARFSEPHNPDTVGATTVVFPTVVNTGATAAPGFQIGPFAPRPAAADYGPADFEVRHNATFSHIWEVPVGRNRRFLSGANKAVDGLLGGWRIAGIGTIRSGNVVNLTLGADVNDDGALNDRPALLRGSLDDLYNRGGDRAQFLIPQAQAASFLGTPANPADPFSSVGRNALRGPRLWSYDLSLIKRIAVTERVALAIEANAFNVFNRANMNTPQAAINSALFGQVTSTMPGFGPRQMQFGIKLTF